MNILSRGIWLLRMCVFVALATTVNAESRLQSFADDPYYIGHGGNAPTLEALAAAPQMYFRSEVARQRIASHLGVSEDALGQMLATLTVEDCRGRGIVTAGISLSGEVVRMERSCYRGEQLLMRTHNGRQTVVMSLGCLNPVYRIIEIENQSRTMMASPPSATAHSPQCRFVRESTQQFSGSTQRLNEFSHCNCFSVPGATIQTPATIQYISRLVCD
jgi:hypothetical protein